MSQSKNKSRRMTHSCTQRPSGYVSDPREIQGEKAIPKTFAMFCAWIKKPAETELTSSHVSPTQTPWSQPAKPLWLAKGAGTWQGRSSTVLFPHINLQQSHGISTPPHLWAVHSLPMNQPSFSGKVACSTSSMTPTFWLRKPSQWKTRAADALSRFLASQTTTHSCNLVSLWKLIFSLKIKKMDFSLYERNTFKIGKNVCVLFKWIDWLESEKKTFYKPPFCRWWASPYINQTESPPLQQWKQKSYFAFCI